MAQVVWDSNPSMGKKVSSFEKHPDWVLSQLSPLCYGYLGS